LIRTSQSRLWKFSAIALLALLACVLCARLRHPWTYNDDYNGAFWSQAARNLSRAGFLATAGVPAPLYFGAPPIPAEALYVHHPTLLSAMMYLDRALLGETESAARILPIFFSLLTAALLWLFASSSSGWRCGTLVLAFFVAAPMELHYGQMVNFEAPELFFLLSTICAFHRWREHRTTTSAALLLICVALAIWTDWQGYLLAALLTIQLLLEAPARNARISAALLLTAFLSGLAFLLQIHLASPGAWQELLHAFRERSSHADLSGGSFSAAQWLRTEFDYITTLFHPAALLIAAAGALLAFLHRRTLTARHAALLHTGTLFFILDLIYICALRNQSYIHDFASFYFLIPVAIFSAYLIHWLIHQSEARAPRPISIAATAAACALAAAFICSGIRRLDAIDTQFCILDDDGTEPPTLMPDIGHLIDRTFPGAAVIICNFDKYYSPLPYYARRVMTNDVTTYPAWREAVSDALPTPAGGIIWPGAPGAADLIRHLPASEIHPVTIDGIPFLLWLPIG